MISFLKKLPSRRNIEDDEFAQKAIDSLYKKLKVKNGAIEELNCILNNPQLPSKCITIPRSLDGRLQVCHKKGLPHVIYCKIFRWPDLQSHHELKSIDSCQYSFCLKRNQVCINPYHYERVHLSLEHHSNLLKKSSFENITFHSYDSNVNREEFYFNNYTSNHNQTFKNYDANCNYTNFNSSFSNTSSGSPPQNPNLSEEFYDNNLNASPLANNEKSSQWCSIVYYELNIRVGEIFHSSSNDIFIDGYTNPNFSGQRFCLGAFTNIQRTYNIENCRKHIGKGIRIFFNVDDSDIYVECLSEYPIFIQSRNFNYERGYHPYNVLKLQYGYRMKVFQSKLFANLLQTAMIKGFDSVYDLSHMCVIKISFVKGWGEGYYRQDVSSCPCWIELRLNEPFKQLDLALKELGSSSDPVTSVS